MSKRILFPLVAALFACSGTAVSPTADTRPDTVSERDAGSDLDVESGLDVERDEGDVVEADAEQDSLDVGAGDTLSDVVEDADPDPRTPAERQRDWFIGAVNSGPADLTNEELASHFNDLFLSEVPVTTLRQVLVDLNRDLAPLTLVGSESSGEYSLQALVSARTGDRFVISVATEEFSPFRMTGLLIEPEFTVDPDLFPTSWDELLTRLAVAAEATNFLAAELLEGGECVAIAEASADDRLALGSAFKLYVLAALADAVATGDSTWDEPLAVREEWKSLPSGRMQTEAAGTEFELVHYATQMISISDNTATDHLIRRLGRETVEAIQAEAGHVDPSVNTPFLTTRELFLIKGALDDSARAAYLEMGSDDRRSYLDEVLVERELSEFRGWSQPLSVDELEWFASPNELCGVMSHLRDQSMQPATAAVADVLSANPGLGFGADWSFIGFKGGSEPGVLNFTWLLERADGHWFFLTFGLQDTGVPVDDAEPIHLALGAAQLLAAVE